MIRINLARGTSKSKKGGGGGLPKRIIFVLLLLAALGGGAYYYITYAPELPDFFASKPEPVTATLPPPIPKKDVPAAAKPSSAVRTNMAENVVKEVDPDNRADKRAANKLNEPYEDMSPAEKINYEVLFGRHVFDMITRCTPPGIRFRTLEVENFQTVYASGAGVSRQMVQEMFAAFKNERGELLPKPLSHIKDDDGRNNFQFVITHKPRFGHSAADPFQAIDRIGFRESVPQHVKAFSRLAGENNYKMSAAPAQITNERAGGYRRVVFRAVGMASYGDFHRFVTALYNERVPCAFKKISMTPIKDEQIRVTVEVLFTVKE